MSHDSLDLRDLVSIEKWQNTQDMFADVLGLSIQTTDSSGKALTKISKLSRLWDIIARDSVTLPESISDAKNVKCPFGLDIFVIPIKVFGIKPLASVTIGPLFLNKRKDKSEYIAEAKKIGVDPERVMDVLIEINVFSYNKIHSIVSLFTDIFSNMAQAGYHKKRLGEIGHDVVEMDPIFATHYERTILKALLNTCISAFDVDSGSVMIVDKKTHHLHIKVATKLDGDIVRDTNLAMGEGIAGAAALASMPIILPNDMKRNGLSKKMKRDYIKSSMIVPFSKNDTTGVYGVINLNVLRKKKEFSEKDIGVIKSLINFASAALSPVQ